MTEDEIAAFTLTKEYDMYDTESLEDLIDDCAYAVDILVEKLEDGTLKVLNKEALISKLNLIRSDYETYFSEAPLARNPKKLFKKVLKLDTKVAKVTTKQLDFSLYPYTSAALTADKELRKMLKTIRKTQLPLLPVVSMLEMWLELRYKIDELRDSSLDYGNLQNEVESALDGYAELADEHGARFQQILGIFRDPGDAPTTATVVLDLEEILTEIKKLAANLDAYMANMNELNK